MAGYRKRYDLGSMNRKLTLLVALLAIAVTGCDGPNPNPGERTTDVAWTSSDFSRAFEVAKPRAEAGEPWAQLRLGIFYENGWGVDKDVEKAEHWYKKAASQKSIGDWAECNLVGAVGKPGYFNQNSNARIAQFNLAQLYYANGKNLLEAKKLIDVVMNESNGKAIFFCCELSGGRSFTLSQFTELKQKIEKNWLFSNVHSQPAIAPGLREKPRRSIHSDVWATLNKWAQTPTRLPASVISGIVLSFPHRHLMDLQNQSWHFSAVAQ
jgi:Sel1 repeat